MRLSVRQIQDLPTLRVDVSPVLEVENNTESTAIELAVVVLGSPKTPN